jgi:mycoredoxin
MPTPKIVVYGAEWCALTTRALTHLEQKGFEYEYIDIEEDEAAARWVRQQNDGKERKPTIKIGDRVLVEPTNAELDRALSALTTP